LTVSEQEFWRLVNYRREKLADAISIKRARDKIIKDLWPTNGGPPFAYRVAFEIAGSRAVSRAEYEEARRLFVARDAIIRADDPPRDSPGKIGRSPYVRPAAKSEAYALGLYGLELEDAMRKAGRKRAGIWTMNSVSMSHENWGRNAEQSQQGQAGFSIEALDCSGFSPEEIAILSAHMRSLRLSGKGLLPGRKRGRPSIYGKAMTNTQRSRRHRAKELA
jgi:hypothetical protein